MNKFIYLASVKQGSKYEPKMAFNTVDEAKEYIAGVIGGDFSKIRKSLYRINNTL